MDDGFWVEAENYPASCTGDGLRMKVEGAKYSYAPPDWAICTMQGRVAQQKRGAFVVVKCNTFHDLNNKGRLVKFWVERLSAGRVKMTYDDGVVGTMVACSPAQPAAAPRPSQPNCPNDPLSYIDIVKVDAKGTYRISNSCSEQIIVALSIRNPLDDCERDISPVPPRGSIATQSRRTPEKIAACIGGQSGCDVPAMRANYGKCVAR